MQSIHIYFCPSTLNTRWLRNHLIFHFLLKICTHTHTQIAVVVAILSLLFTFGTTCLHVLILILFYFMFRSLFFFLLVRIRGNHSHRILRAQFKSPVIRNAQNEPSNKKKRVLYKSAMWNRNSLFINLLKYSLISNN